ncbi:hypothetical protein [Brevibacterium casei]|uniref:hypothetical protein n=1 Tax=Brevibacterium casei TaxID=33889 RepID=UPI003158B02A
MKPEMRGRRARRGAAAAVFATFLALTSHILGGGSMPTLMGIAVPLALSALVCVLLAGRKLSLPRLSVSVGISQTLFHSLFSVFTPTHTMTGPMTALDRQAMQHAGMGHDPGSAMASMPSMGGSGAMMHSHASPQMMLMHVIAGIVTIAVIYWAEALPARLSEFARRVIDAIVPVLVTIRPLPERPRLTVAITVLAPHALTTLRSPVLRRGPPHPAF